jgi:DNA repair exonuclease SbcCD ATPase subunit
MPLSNAERQQAFRQRRARALKDARAEIDRLRRQLAEAQQDLDGALAEVERLSSAQCKHPAEAVDGGTCRACGQDVW